MNILLKESWNPLTQRDVPDLYVADFGIASQVQTLATRITGRRGTPGYEAPEIRGYPAAFSQKSDVYAFGCILHRICTLEEPKILDDTKPNDIAGDYSFELLSLVSSMLSSKREDRPTATQVKERLAAVVRKMFTVAVNNSPTCLICHQSFPSKTQLWKHRKAIGHHKQSDNNLNIGNRDMKSEPRSSIAVEDVELRIKGVADAPANYHYDNIAQGGENLSPCVVCWRDYASKRQLYKHLYCNEHVRKQKLVTKRLAGIDEVEVKANKRQRA